MIVTRTEILKKGHLTFEKDYHQGDLTLNSKDIIEFQSAHATFDIDHLGNFVIIKIGLDFSLVLKSTRSLKPVPYSNHDEDEITYTLKGEGDDEILKFEGEELDLDEHVVSLIISSLPCKIYRDDDEINVAGDGYEVISEDEYYRRQQEAEDPRLEKLKDFIKDDEEN